MFELEFDIGENKEYKVEVIKDIIFNTTKIIRDQLSRLYFLMF